MKRRLFLLLGAKAAVGFVLTQAVPARALSGISGKNTPRTLSFYHTHTHEHLTVTYANAGIYDPVALEKSMPISEIFARRRSILLTRPYWIFFGQCNRRCAATVPMKLFPVIAP